MHSSAEVTTGVSAKSAKGGGAGLQRVRKLLWKPVRSGNQGRQRSLIEGGEAAVQGSTRGLMQAVRGD